MVYGIPTDKRTSKGVFFDLFDDIPDYLKIGRHQDSQRRELHISDRYPTNTQAEVFVFGAISIQYMKSVYFDNRISMNKYINYTPQNINVKVNFDIFSYCCDYELWGYKEKR